MTAPAIAACIPIPRHLVKCQAALKARIRRAAWYRRQLQAVEAIKLIFGCWHAPYWTLCAV